MTVLLGLLLVILSVASAGEACSCARRHPQEMFCSSHFVVRAKVLARELRQETRVLTYNLTILKTYKGAVKLNQTEGCKVNGSRGRCLFVKAYTGSDSAVCSVDWLQNNTVYLLAGYIHGEQLWLSLCGWNTAWSRVTDQQRAGIRGFYGENCECKIGWCYDCAGKLKGCDAVAKIKGKRFYTSCEWRHSYCLKNSNHTACYWRETAGYKNCINQP